MPTPEEIYGPIDLTEADVERLEQLKQTKNLKSSKDFKIIPERTTPIT